jgi:Lanthionine synthetase C-like protein
MAGLRWEEARAHGADGRRCPAMCAWTWDQHPRDGAYTGTGMGISGIAYMFDLFAQRTGSRTFERYATGAARYVESLISRRYNAVPEQPGQPGWDTGYLSGSAGDAFMFLSLYHHTRSPRWLHDAVRLLGFVDLTGHVARGQESWPIEFDPSGRQRNNAVALGTEEGNAGIGWAMLNAYQVTGRLSYLAVAQRAGNYLVAHLTRMHGGLACAEDIRQGNTTLFHTSLDNGDAGCGFFLHDLSVVTGNRKYQHAAAQITTWLRASARTGHGGIWWYDQFNSATDRWIHPREMSWHWGQAGIIAFLARLTGWSTSMPVEEQSIVPLRTSPALPRSGQNPATTKPPPSSGTSAAQAAEHPRAAEPPLRPFGRDHYAACAWTASTIPSAATPGDPLATSRTSWACRLTAVPRPSCGWARTRRTPPSCGGTGRPGRCWS